MRIESLEVGEARVGRMLVGSYDSGHGVGGDGLLGRDFLDQFNVNIDSPPRRGDAGPEVAAVGPLRGPLWYR